VLDLAIITGADDDLIKPTASSNLGYLLGEVSKIGNKYTFVETGYPRVKKIKTI
jgi:hypothetical protein